MDADLTSKLARFADACDRASVTRVAFNDARDAARRAEQELIATAAVGYDVGEDPLYFVFGPNVVILTVDRVELDVFIPSEPTE